MEHSSPLIAGVGLSDRARKSRWPARLDLNTWYYSDAPKTVRPMLDQLRRQSTFDEVQGGLDEANALFEARRCLSCGNCFECDNCYGVCPDNAVIKLSPGKALRIQLRLLQGMRDGGSMQQTAAVPDYLQETYWWAYVHPNAVRIFERQWLVNLILWGNFARLRDAALRELGDELPGRTLQVACVYGDFTPRLLERVTRGAGTLDVVDVLPIQLSNLGRKLDKLAPVNLMQRDAADLGFATDSYNRVILFFLLHEMPLDVRRRTLAEAMRVLKPGAELVIVDYHRPAAWHPLRSVMTFILRTFEPFAMDLWAHEVAEWLPKGASVARKETFWGGLYQKLVVRK